MNEALIVFAKVPRPGEVKTRLTPLLSQADAARVYTAFLRDGLRLYERLDVDIRLYVAPPVPSGEFPGIPTGVTVYEQTGPDLGARMQAAFRETFQDGIDSAAIVGTDHPTLPLEFVERAFRALETPNSICVGPSEDGGFYLLGMSTFYPRLFEGMTYSHDRVLTETLARVEVTEARLTLLPQWYDVDTPDDLRRMIRDLEENDPEAPNTRRIIAHLGIDGPE